MTAVLVLRRAVFSGLAPLIRVAEQTKVAEESPLKKAAMCEVPGRASLGVPPGEPHPIENDIASLGSFVRGDVDNGDEAAPEKQIARCPSPTCKIRRPS